MRAVGDDVVDVGHRRRVHDADEALLGTVHRRRPEFGRRRRALHGIGRPPVAHHHPVRRAAGGRLEPHLRVHGVCAKECKVHPAVSSRLRGVEHLLRPVLVVSCGQERLVISQRRAIGVRVDIGRVRRVVSRLLEPADEVDLPLVEVPHA